MLKHFDNSALARYTGRELVGNREDRMAKKRKKGALPHPGRGGPGATTRTAAGLYRTTVYFDKEERRALKIRAVDEDKPITALLRRWVREKTGLRKIDL